MPATLKDIAKQLQVSVSTVSRALQNHPRIGIETKQKIQELANKLDYQPNAFAINLKKKTSKTIGVIVPDLTVHFFSEILAGMDAVAHQHGYNLLFCQSAENEEREKSQLLQLYKANVDAILVASSKNTSNFGAFIELQNKGFPILFFSRIHPHFPAVLSDDLEGAKSVTQHLIAKGSKRIAHVAGPWYLRSTADRLNGYANALKESNIQVQKEWIVYSEMERENNIEAIHKLLNLPEKPDAIFCFNDYVAYDIIQVLKEKNIIAGKDILVAGYGNQPLAQHIEPSLTTVDQNAFEIGKKSVALIIELLNTKPLPTEKPIITLPTKLVVRSSTAGRN